MNPPHSRLGSIGCWLAGAGLFVGAWGSGERRQHETSHDGGATRWQMYQWREPTIYEPCLRLTPEWSCMGIIMPTACTPADLDGGICCLCRSLPSDGCIQRATVGSKRLLSRAVSEVLVNMSYLCLQSALSFSCSWWIGTRSSPSIVATEQGLDQAPQSQLQTIHTPLGPHFDSYVLCFETGYETVIGSACQACTAGENGPAGTVPGPDQPKAAGPLCTGRRLSKFC